MLQYGKSRGICHQEPPCYDLVFYTLRRGVYNIDATYQSAGRIYIIVYLWRLLQWSTIEVDNVCRPTHFGVGDTEQYAVILRHTDSDDAW